MRILYTRDAETVAYAAEELKKYIVAMSGGEICPDICRAANASPAPDAILLATLADLDLFLILKNVAGKLGIKMPKYFA